IDQCCERDWRELHVVAGGARHRQCGAELPPARQCDRGHEAHIVRSRALGIKDDRIPVQVEKIAGSRGPPPPALSCEVSASSDTSSVSMPAGTLTWNSYMSTASRCHESERPPASI